VADALDVRFVVGVELLGARDRCALRVKKPARAFRAFGFDRIFPVLVLGFSLTCVG
jgi:hypothetical protein